MRSPSELRARCAVYDIDGTLVNSRDAVVAAYKSVGVVMPDDAWGKPWYTWLPTVTGSNSEAMALHRQKNKVYLSGLARNDLPVNHRLVDQIVRQDEEGYDIRFLTGMSAEPANYILSDLLMLDQIGITPMLSCDYETKLSSMAFFFDMYGPTNLSYYDDDIDVLDKMSKVLPKSVNLISVQPWT